MSGKSECLSGLEVDEHGRLHMYGYQKYIQVKLEVPGYHRWLGAPEEIAFLRFYHRHVFTIRVQIEIDSDRQLEYFLVQNKLKELVNDYIARQVDLTKDYDPEDFYELTGQGTGMEEQDVLVINSCEDFAEKQSLMSRFLST